MLWRNNELVISLSDDAKKKRKRGCCVVVRNLKKDVKVQDLYSLFEEVGAVDVIELQKSRRGDRIPALVFFYEPVARIAVEKFHKFKFGNDVIDVELSHKFN
ncbi:hypothetical protein B4U80_12600 [Leptotrombidium deliense]|uniref:RRM domain-containing protein n=1 Tax=Leptotrombidium deliense TaxID=299467 RepID=A0A443R4C4_9ACAR|nr:hypothetical protein B4U80_12600 [Leptotrombidium deliense]